MVLVSRSDGTTSRADLETLPSCRLTEVCVEAEHRVDVSVRGPSRHRAGELHSVIRPKAVGPDQTRRHREHRVAERDPYERTGLVVPVSLESRREYAGIR